MSETSNVPVAAPEKPTAEQLATRDPFSMLAEMQAEFARLWDRNWRLWSPRRRSESTDMSLWAPKMDVFQKDGKLVLKADLPGMKKEDVEVMLDNGDLVIRGERRQESEVREEDYYRSERSYGSFYRRMALGAEVKPDQVKATFKDGVLEVTVPQPPAPAQPKPARIPVS